MGNEWEETVSNQNPFPAFVVMHAVYYLGSNIVLDLIQDKFKQNINCTWLMFTKHTTLA